MRPIERIDNFLEKVDWNTLFNNWGLQFDNKKYYYIEDFQKLFEKYWKENPDRRIGQVLSDLNILPNYEDPKSYGAHTWWTDEESDILISQCIAPEDCLYWTSIFDKEGNELDMPVTRLVSSLSKEHIGNILMFMSTNGGRVSPQMMQAFVNVLTK